MRIKKCMPLLCYFNFKSRNLDEFLFNIVLVMSPSLFVPLWFFVFWHQIDWIEDGISNTSLNNVRINMLVCLHFLGFLRGEINYIWCLLCPRKDAWGLRNVEVRFKIDSHALRRRRVPLAFDDMKQATFSLSRSGNLKTGQNPQIVLWTVCFETSTI